MHELSHEFTSRKVSPWGGMKLFKAAYEQSGMSSFFDNGIWPFSESNRGYDTRHLVEQFISAAVLGSRRLAHGEYLRADEVLKELFGWDKGVASSSTMSRFFGKIDDDKAARLLPLMFRHFWARQLIKSMTVDLDSTVIQRYGSGVGIEGASKGYNAKRPGRLSHHPIMAFCDDLKMVCNTWMRPGDAADALWVADFMAETIAVLGGRQRIGLVRADAGFYADRLMRTLEGNLTVEVLDSMCLNHWLTDYKDEQVRAQLTQSTSPIDYIIRAKMTGRLLSKISDLDESEWHCDNAVFKDAEYADLEYKATSWAKARRIVVMRRKKSKKTAGCQPKLFASDERLRKYVFMAFVTSLEAGSGAVHLLYNGRADCENRIKELKYDYGIDGFALKKQSATATAFALVMIAYNIMGLLKQYVLKNQKRLSTIRFQCIAIGSYLVKSGRKKILKLSAEGKRRHFLEHIFDNVDNIGKQLAK